MGIGELGDKRRRARAPVPGSPVAPRNDGGCTFGSATPEYQNYHLPGYCVPSHVYLLASRPYGTLYLGVTSNLGRRIVEHRGKAHPGFTAKYGVDRLVWMEDYDRIADAIAREKTIKKWRRDWKIALIEGMNPKWEDLFGRLNW